MPRHRYGRRRRKKRAWKTYTQGELNKLIDSLCHPLFNTNEGYILIDGILHGLVEQDPELTIRKFVKYNFPALVKRIIKKTGKDKRRKTRNNKS